MTRMTFWTPWDHIGNALDLRQDLVSLLSWSISGKALALQLQRGACGADPTSAASARVKSEHGQLGETQTA